MSTFILDERELPVLLALRTEAGMPMWRTPAEIAQIADVHVQYVRDRLRAMAQRGLVERGGWGESVRWGEWRLTDKGVGELAARDQLRLTS